MMSHRVWEALDCLWGQGQEQCQSQAWPGWDQSHSCSPAVTQGWTLLEAAASTGFALKGDWPTCDHQEQFRSSGMRIPFSPLNPGAHLHIGNTNIPSFLPLLSSPAGENPSPPNSWGLKGFPGLFEELILWFCPSVKASLELLCLSICSNTNPWGCSQFSSHRGKFAWDELRELGSEKCIFWILQLNSYSGLKRFENGIKCLI